MINEKNLINLLNAFKKECHLDIIEVMITDNQYYIKGYDKGRRAYESNGGLEQ